MKSKEDSSFPADGHKNILNKMNNKSITNRKRTNIDNYNKSQQKHRLGTVSNKLLGELKPVLRDHTPRPGFCCGSYNCKLFGPHEGLLTHQCIKQLTYQSRFNAEMKQDEYSTTRQTLKRWSNRNPAVKRQIIKPQPTSLKVFRLEPSLSPRPVRKFATCFAFYMCLFKVNVSPFYISLIVDLCFFY